MNRANFIYQFTGTIQTRILNKVSPESKYAGKEYYKLKITQPNSLKTIQVFQDKLANPVIWETIQKAKKGEFSTKQFIFSCRNVRGYYYLVNWEELPRKEETP